MTVFASFKGIHLSAIPFRGAAAFFSPVDTILASLFAGFSEGFPSLRRGEFFKVIIEDFSSNPFLNKGFHSKCPVDRAMFDHKDVVCSDRSGWLNRLILYQNLIEPTRLSGS